MLKVHMSAEANLFEFCLGNSSSQCNKFKFISTIFLLQHFDITQKLHPKLRCLFV